MPGTRPGDNEMKWWLSAFTLAGMVAAGMFAPEKQTVTLEAPADVSVSVLPDAAETVEVAKGPTPSISFFRITGTTSRERYRSAISDSEAIAIALARGEELKTTQSSPAPLAPQPTPVASIDAPAAEIATPAAPVWRVTSDSVNLRSGPGTGNAVISKANTGDELTPISGLGSDWVEVNLPSGSTGWIFAKYLARADS